MKSLRSTVVVTGDVDAGKSTLIGRLLAETGSLRSGHLEDVVSVSRRFGRDVEYAYLLDSFEEERARELTLDTTQVFCKVNPREQILLIDVPGHRELLSSMLSGASFADAAVLVVDIRSTVDAQALRHAWILKFLGIESPIVAVNKLDAVDYSQERFSSARNELDRLFSRNEIYPRAVVPIAARGADNLVARSRAMAWYKGPVLFDLLKEGFVKKTSAGFRLAVQDSYEVGGDEFALGSILGGALKKKDRVEVLPAGNTSTVQALRALKPVSSARYPQAVGVQIKGVRARRGQILCKPPLPHISNDLRAKLFCVAAFDRKEDFTVRCATQTVKARCIKLGFVRNVDGLKQKDAGAGLDAGDTADASILCSEPVVYDTLPRNNALSRFVIHQRGAICAFGLMEGQRP